MFEIQVIPAALFFCAGTIAGISVTLLFNKMRTGSASAGKIKQEMEDYQGEVEAHFEETSKKFKDMAAQYQDLYQHLSVGATTLCRSGNVIAGLNDQRDPLAMAPTIELRGKQTDANRAVKKDVDKKTVDVEQSIEKSTNSMNGRQPEPKRAEPSRVEPSQPEAKKDQTGKKPTEAESNSDTLTSRKPV
ncbi:MAG: uncharacterized membrane-anchored protein YhcB (DUF1043 family) [Arenicella sp.]|jgi:uncharacterized membrane-anchored protein YhcB (DUF1043 family)